MSTTAPNKPTCSRCGVETDQVIGDVAICDACYIAAGSCCAEAETSD